MPYQPQVPPPDEQLVWIGRITVEWSFLESVVDAAIGTLANIEDVDSLEAIATHIAFKTRSDMLATLFDLACRREAESGSDATALELRQRRFRELRGRLDSLAGKRNGIVHARWVVGPMGSPMTYMVKARGSLQRTKRGVSAIALHDVAAEIAELSGDLIDMFTIAELGQ